MSYTLQDLKCKNCKQIKQENMKKYCLCAGEYGNLLHKGKMKVLFESTFYNIANLYNMSILKEFLNVFKEYTF